MTAIHELPTPALVVDVARLAANLHRMAERATALGVALRPHVKTHKCLEIAERQHAVGARGFTVSTLYEAEVLASRGFDDVIWAYPVILNRIPAAAALAERITLRLVVDSVEAVQALAATNVPFNVWLKVDCGYHRAGVDPDDDAVLRVVEAIHTHPHLVFDGILSHSGHAYDARTADEAAAIAEDERRVMTTCADRLRAAGLPVPGVSVGSTPAVCAAHTLDGITEVRPGNYALFDRTQAIIGSCAVADCAVTVVTSVVSQSANHAIVDAGALALSKDSGASDAAPRSFGEVFENYDAHRLHTELRLTTLSQEHGRLSQPVAVGTRLRILPNHSCLTVAQFDTMYAVEGNRVVGTWKVWRGRD